ncbi:MAG: replicative DNA helicase [Dehalococcoidia bacterium]
MQADRLPPHDIQAEESVIGSLLIDGESITRISSFLKPDDFYRERNRWCFEACLALFDRDDAINQVTVAHELESRGTLTEAGGSAYLSHVVAVVPTSVHIEYYGRLVHRTATMRRLITAANDIADIGYSDGPDVEVALSQAEDVLFNIRSGHQSRDFIPLREPLEPYLEATSPLDALDTDTKGPVRCDFREFDQLFGGLQRSDMIVLAARPSVGKSTLGLNLARNAARNGAAVGIFSLEMGREQIAMRLLAAEARVDMHRLRMRMVTEMEQERVVDSIGFLSDMPIYIDDTPFQTVVEMRGKARRLQLERGLDFVVVDYMQLISGSSQRRDGNRTQEVSEISRQMKAMARDLNVPVLAVSQLSRAIEQRQSHRPVLSDLRESGSIEQDADVVMFIHREEKFTNEDQWSRSNPGQPYPRGLAEIIVAKHRHGPTAEFWMTVRDSVGRFEDAPRTTPAMAPERV